MDPTQELIAEITDPAEATIEESRATLAELFRAIGAWERQVSRLAAAHQSVALVDTDPEMRGTHPEGQRIEDAMLLRLQKIRKNGREFAQLLSDYRDFCRRYLTQLREKGHDTGR